LKVADIDARLQAALALWRIDHRAAESLPVLVAALKSTAPPPQRGAVNLPGRFGLPQSVPPVPACQQAAEVLGKMGPEARPAVPALTEVLKDPQFSSFRPYFALALLKIDRQAAGVAVPALIDVLEGKSRRQPEPAASALRKQAAAALGDIGAEARKAVPSLRKALEDADEGVRTEASLALKKIGA
jgi:HEAT repeat protein